MDKIEKYINGIWVETTEEFLDKGDIIRFNGINKSCIEFIVKSKPENIFHNGIPFLGYNLIVNITDKKIKEKLTKIIENTDKSLLDIIKDKTNLECSSAGDKRFSALKAKVKLFGEEKTIEEWYQLSKKFGNKTFNDWKLAKQRSRFSNPTSIVINNIELDIKYLIPWYKLLWLIFLDLHPQLVKELNQYDTFSDKYKGKSRISQADVICQYVKISRKSVLEDCRELINILKIGDKFEL